MKIARLLRSIVARKGPKWMGPIQSRIPYPLRAARIQIAINVFGCWWKPSWWHRKDMSEQGRASGSTIWCFEWLKFQISYSRWL